MTTETRATLKSLDDIRRGTRALVRACPTMRAIHGLAGDPPLRRERSGFEGLAGIVVAQQVSAASAAAIWKRTRLTLGRVTPTAIATASDETLRAAGLSRGKILTLRRLAEAAETGALDLARLSRRSDAAIHDALTAIKGIGPWTADIYIMFALGRADAWAPGDLALRLAIARAERMPAPPSPGEIAERAEAWRPWRGVAARLLWHYYALPQPHLEVQRKSPKI